MGVDAFIEQQLHPERISEKRLDAWLGKFPSLLLNYRQMQEAYPEREDVRRVTTEVRTARVARALLAERQLEEVMTDFWLNHFSVYSEKGALERYMLAEYENRVIRPRALGNFRELLGAVAKSPAMLFYLDNWQSAADSGRPRLADGRARAGAAARARGLNENYGRELLELHTLGVDGGYAQEDVLGAARALTGWTFIPARPQQASQQPAQRPRQGTPRRAQLRQPPGEFLFNPLVHDAGEKRVLGHRLRAGRGIEDGEELLDIVARHPATARHIATKLVRRFVSDEPPPDLVDRAAREFERTRGNIRSVLRLIVTSDEFFADAAFRAKLKTPFELVASTLRALGAEPDSTPRSAQVVASLGQPIYGRPTPDGWPDVAGEWLGTGAILNRINFGVMVGAGRLPGANATQWPGADALVRANREQQVDGVIAALLGGRATPETRTVLLSGENPLAREASSMDGGRPVAPLRGLAQTVALAIGSPDFQRR
jgi:uncharacterized protein (DUF1800 family)